MQKIIFTAILFLTFGAATAQKPVYDLVERVSAGAGKQFLFELSDQESETDFFEIDQKGGKIWIKGNNNISIATGLNWYLKYHAGIQITWNNPRPYLGDLPKVKTAERRSTDVLLRYYMNYETFSYSTPFWDWARWQQEIDFMALHGINMPLALTGTCTVWRNTLLKLGYTKEQANNFIADPVHQAWFVRGLMMSEGESNTDSYYESQEKLERQIVERYREWGIEPVFAGYSGITPPTADAKKEQWNGNNSPAIVSADKFAEVAKVYYSELETLFGKAKYYAVDTKAASSAVYEAMQSANTGAIWVTQNSTMTEAVPPSRLIVLGAQSDLYDWIYCPKLNVGGNTGMHGKMQSIIDAYYSSLSPSMKGIGAMSEGIETNPAIYELLYELPWRSEKFTKESWIATWTAARYGRTTPEIDQAWSILANTVYNNGAIEPVMCSRPALVVDRITPNGSTKLNYDAAELEKALGLMLGTASKFSYSNNFKYDLVDIAGQAISNRVNALLPNILMSFEKGLSTKLDEDVETFLDLILLQDRLMGSRPETMVGGWIEQAMRAGKTPDEHELNRRYARQILTTWGSREAAVKGGMHDTAYREWNGLLSDFYYARWKYFFDQIKITNIIPIGYNYYDMEQAWVMEQNPYEHRPTADAIAMANEVYIFIGLIVKK